MNFTKLATGAALALGIALLSSPAAKANVILAYTGNVFTVFSAPYTGTDKVTASITLANPLGDNLNFVPVTPLAFSMSDGEQTLTNETTLHATNFAFSTDSTGAISLWVISAGTPDGNEILSERETGLAEDFALANGGQSEASNRSHPGIWTETTAPVPAPPLSNLAAFGVLGLAFFWRRGRQIFGLGRAQ